MHRKKSIAMVACDHGAAAEIEALLGRQQELVAQLRALILPQLHGGTTAELAVQLFDDVIGCNTSVLSRLLAGSLFGTGRGEPAAVDLVDDDETLVRKNSATCTGEGLEEPARPSCSVAKKRRRNDDGKRSRSLVTNTPHYDGHQWRKYGQKNINGRQHARSYYRCAYTERNCSATKTIQQQDQNRTLFSYGEETAKYTVVYYGHHTCEGDNIINGENNINMDLPQLVNLDLQSGEMARTATEIGEFEGDLDVPTLLELLDNSLLNWETMC